MTFQIELDEATAGRRLVPFRLFTSDGTSPDTGASDDTMFLSINGAAQVVSAGSVSAISASAGMYSNTPSAAQVGTLGSVAFYHDDGDFPQHVVTVQVVNYNPMSTQSDLLLTDLSIGTVSHLDNHSVGTVVHLDNQSVGTVDNSIPSSATIAGVTNRLSIASSDISSIGTEVWDRVLTGATHNIATSAGRRLRGIQEFQGYEDGAVWIDTVDGTAGTIDFENGTVENPVDSIADADTIAASLNLKKFQILPGSAITLAAAQAGQVFMGNDWRLALEGQNVVGSHFIGAVVAGIAAGTGTTQVFRDCIMNAVSHIAGTHVITSAIAGTQTLVEAGDHFWDRCHSGIAGTGTPALSFGAAIGNSNVNIRNYSGGVQFEAMGDTGVDTASVEGRGQFIEGTCTGGTVAIRGNFTISGIANLTLTDEARFDVPQITGGEYALNTTASGNIGLDWANVENPATEIDLSSTTINQAATIGAGGILSTSYAAGARDAAGQATDAVNEMADGLLDRDMSTGVDSGSSAVRTARDALRSLRNRVDLSENTLTVFGEDDVTEAWRASLTTTGDSNFPTAMDPSG